ncbi:MAG: S8 family serine peptidase [Candidatus Bathyarchaeota archaeon]|nr:S8 family serine peptidase [Candidatus Bathyarchaeota archaeon]MDH5733747.1 S8 family serine peptidase [Candidatus Bathyarchaeota archaeon]
MKNKLSILVVTIAFSILLSMVSLPQITASSSFQLPYDVEIAREEFAESLETTTLNEGSLPEFVPFWVDLVNAEVVPNDGEGVYVAVLDTGLLNPWPFFFSEANIAWDLRKGFSHDIWWDSGIGDFEMGPLRDDRGVISHPWGSGHGTHVTSTIVGYNINNVFWVRGVAPEATIIPVLVLDYWWLDCPDPNYDVDGDGVSDCHDGKVLFRGGTDEMISAGIYYVADLAETLDGPVIISMSLGGSSPSPMIEDAIDYAIDLGVIVVAAAGNLGYLGMDWPGAYPQVISCAAGGWTMNWIGTGGTWWLSDVSEDLREDDYWGNNWQLYLEDFSSRPNMDIGQKATDLDVTTPGAAVVGPHQPFVSWDGTQWNLGEINYYYVWGTSQATPHVSAMAALILESSPELGQYAMQWILKNAAAGLPIPSDGAWVYDPWYGLYHFEWFGIDWGRGFLQADSAMSVAHIFMRGSRSQHFLVPE